MTEIHFLNVGCGNMQIILLPGGKVFIYDCNITDDNEEDVMSYVKTIIGAGANINVFINSHRDADHMRGIKKLHKKHPIQEIWDSGVPGTTTNSSEYKEYMDLRRQLTTKEIKARKYWEYGDAVLRCMNSKWDDYSDPNDQSIVLKVENKGASAILAGDTSYKPWKEKILTYYGNDRLSASILLAAHHGSLTFFDDPSDEKNYYTDHIKKVAPAMTLVSVGPNTHDLPDDKAMELYKRNSSGSDKGNKVYTTEDKGNMKLLLKDDGGWNLKVDQ
jgi:beta-lactamase superfamily II metal-dependent hydrolase